MKHQRRSIQSTFLVWQELNTSTFNTQSRLLLIYFILHNPAVLTDETLKPSLPFLPFSDSLIFWTFLTFVYLLSFLVLFGPPARLFDLLDPFYLCYLSTAIHLVS